MDRCPDTGGRVTGLISTSRITFELETSIAAEPALVYAELSEPSRQIGLQPFLRQVRETQRGTDPDGVEFRVFASHEAVPFVLGVHLPNRIQVRVRLVEPEVAIEFLARSAPGIRVESRFELAGGIEARRESETEPRIRICRVRERVALTAPRILMRFVADAAREAQSALLENLRTRLSGPTAGS